VLDDVEHDIDALAAIAFDDARRRRQAALLVAMQAGFGIVAGQKFLGDGLAVEDRLRSAIGADGIHRMGGIAQQSGPAVRPARQRIAIDHREFQDGVGGTDDARHVEPVELPVLEARQEIGKLAGRFQSSRGSIAPSPMCRSQIQLISASPFSACARLMG